MHHGPETTPGLLAGLGGFYVLVALLNAGAAAWIWNSGRRRGLVGLWGAVSAVFLILALLGFAGSELLVLPHAFRDTIDGLAGPVTYTLAAVVGFTVMLVFRGFFVRPEVAWAGLNVLLLFFGYSMTDADFRSIVGKPDNVPISGMIILLGFFTWLGLWRAVRNDRRVAEGRPLIEQQDNEKVLVWPDLVYTELICMVVLTAVLILWSIVLKAPLEQPATDLKTPNPSKAPWYFLGLQEMLVYYDPWMAGVVLPSFIIVGLIAMPYIDFNKQGNGYYTFNQRKFAMVTFLFGFLVLWVTLILLGTFLRGPNWNFFGPYEPWDVHKVEALNNVQLSEYFWVWMLGRGLPSDWYVRELPGLLLVLLYLFAIPPALGLTVLRKFLVRMGFIRYMVLANLILFMAALPIKMVLRWTINLKYIVYIPEFFFNI